ncbi:Retrovirus-related Pol polyprotein from transposon 17.6, partial [Mucuna pruriens]
CRPINFTIIRYVYPISRLYALLDELYIYEVDIIRYVKREGGEWKIAFKTKLRLYEWLIMPFRLTNAPSTFMQLMNHVLRFLIGKHVVVYFDYILVYSNCIDDHILHVKSVLLLLRQECLYVSIEKCMFYTSELVFLGYVVGFEGVKATQKIEGEVRSFHRRFVKDFSTLASPLNRIERLTNALILALPNFSKTFELEYDAPCGSRNFSTYDKELYALVRAYKCGSTTYCLKNFDHEALKHLRSQNKLNKRHAKCVEFLEQFSYVIKHT